MEAAPDTAPSEAEVAAYAAPLLAALPCVCVKCSSIATPVTPAAASSVTAECAARFLRICSGDCAKAAHVLTAHVQWRQSFGVDALMAEPEETSYARARAIQQEPEGTQRDSRSEASHIWFYVAMRVRPREQMCFFARVHLALSAEARARKTTEMRL